MIYNVTLTWILAIIMNKLLGYTVIWSNSILMVSYLIYLVMWGYGASHDLCTCRLGMVSLVSVSYVMFKGFIE